jgi:hypothetical protein
MTTTRGRYQREEVFLHFCSLHFCFFFNSGDCVEQKFSKNRSQRSTSLRLKKSMKHEQQDKRLSGIAVKYVEGVGCHRSEGMKR